MKESAALLIQAKQYEDTERRVEFKCKNNIAMHKSG